MNHTIAHCSMLLNPRVQRTCRSNVHTLSKQGEKVKGNKHYEGFCRGISRNFKLKFVKEVGGRRKVSARMFWSWFRNFKFLSTEKRPIWLAEIVNDIP